MIRCKVFRIDWNNKNDFGPAYYFNKFCEENPNIEVINEEVSKIDDNQITKIEVEKVITEVDDISMIDTLNGCGNVANGNHTYLTVTALIESEYEKEVVKDKFPDAYEVLHFEELHFETKTSRQFSKYVIDNSKKYYVLVYAKSAPFYYLDLRGH